MYDQLQLVREIEQLRAQVESLRTIEIPGGWKDWTPTVSAGGSMTISDLVITNARYQIQSKTFYFSYRITVTTGGTASNTITIDAASLPISPATESILSTSFSLSLSDGSAALFGGTAFLGVVGQISMRRYDGANFGLGTGRILVCSGFIEIA